MAVTFPDVEKTIVAYLKASLTTTDFASAHVGVKRAEPDTKPYPTEQVVVNVAFGSERDFVVKNATLVLDCYSTDYGRASTLGLLVESIIRGIVGTQIKSASVIMGPVRRVDDTKEELRSIDVQLVIKGSN